jgi:hypothetical protein
VDSARASTVPPRALAGGRAGLGHEAHLLKQGVGQDLFPGGELAAVPPQYPRGDGRAPGSRCLRGERERPRRGYVPCLTQREKGGGRSRRRAGRA